ncbi:MAG: hypothetical protein R3B53_01570 [Candidatus Paceibacterota bacterium]
MKMKKDLWAVTTVIVLTYVKAAGMAISFTAMAIFAYLIVQHGYVVSDWEMLSRHVVGLVASSVLLWIFFTLSPTQRCFDWGWERVREQENTSTATLWR